MSSRLEKELEVVDHLPPPPPLTFKNVTRIIGPSAIVLGVAIGSGEWLIGPANAVLYGAGIMWIATVSILLQTLLNAELVRYTKYTGEPIFNGMLRLWPGPRFWGPFLIVLSVLERAWPAWAFASATALAAAFLGRIPGAGDEVTVIITGLLLALLIVVIVSYGGVIERTLEIVQWTFVFLIIGFLIFLNVLLTPAKVALDVAAGFFKFGYLPSGATVVLLAALAGYAGAGGLNNTTISNYYRDKGFGIGSLVGAIPSLIRGKKITVSPKGKIFKITSENLDAWRKWRLLTWIDIVGIFTTGAFIGMYLCVALAVALIPPGTQIGGWGVAAYQGNTLAARLGFAGWVIALLTGFWILFSTQLGSTDMITRTLTDLLWSFSDRVRKWAGGEIKKLYYTVLTFITIWIFFAFALTYIFKIQPFIWILLVANISNIVLGIVAIATAYMNRKWLPKEIRAPLWSTIVLILGALFFWFFFAAAMILNQFFGIKF